MSGGEPPQIIPRASAGKTVPMTWPVTGGRGIAAATPKPFVGPGQPVVPPGGRIPDVLTGVDNHGGGHFCDAVERTGWSAV